VTAPGAETAAPVRWTDFARDRPALRAAALAAAAVGIVALLIAAALHGRSFGPGSDFHARWTAGRWFMTGEPLYVYHPGLADPTYPPFAAMVFQLFALVPLPVAAGGFFLVNLALAPVAVVLVRRIFRAAWPGWRARWPLVLAAAFSLEFFLANLNALHVNAALFVLLLWGIAASLEGRERAGAVAFVVATGIKLIPVFLAVWAVLRGRGPARLATLVAGLAVLLLPIAQRGPTQGWRDLRDYHATLLSGVIGGAVNARATNHGLAGAMHRLTRPPQPPEPDYRVIALSRGTARTAIRLATVSIGLVFVATIVMLRRRQEPLSVFELSAALLAGHLVSAMTWRAHLVTLLFVLTAFFSIPAARLRAPARATWWALAGLVAVVGLSGRDLIGPDAFRWINGHGVITAALVALFAGSIALARRHRRPWEVASPAIRAGAP
jgi:hypothetical protein